MESEKLVVQRETKSEQQFKTTNYVQPIQQPIALGTVKTEEKESGIVKIEDEQTVFNDLFKRSEKNEDKYYC